MPAFPIAIIILPQFGSSPAIAVFTNGELAIDRAIFFPSLSVLQFKTFIQMFAIATLLTGESGNNLINFGDYNAHSIGIVLLWLSAFLTLYTGYDYVKKGIVHAID